jgi:hypothetical protein
MYGLYHMVKKGVESNVNLSAMKNFDFLEQFCTQVHAISVILHISYDNTLFP